MAQTLKEELYALLDKYGATIEAEIDGDTHGVYDHQVIIYIGNNPIIESRKGIPYLEAGDILKMIEKV